MTLRKWKEEAKTKKFEEAVFNKRRELITRKQHFGNRKSASHSK